MDAFDKVEEQLLAKGYSKEEIPAIMVSLVEQSGVKVVDDLLPDKLQPKAPKAEFGPDRVRPRVRGTRPTSRMPGDPAPRPNFGNNAPRTNAGGAVNIPRTNATTRPVQPQAPVPKFGTTPATPAAPKANLFTRLKSLATPQNLVKGIRGVGGALGSLGAQTVGVELATKLAQTMGKPGQSRMSKFGAEFGDAPVYNTPWSPNNVADAKASGYVPNKGFLNTVRNPSPQPKSTRPKGMSNIPPAEGMVNNPNYGKPGTVQPKVAPTPAPTPTPTPAPPVPKLTTAQQSVNTEYDRLRKSNPADAVKYGLRMARAGASKSSFKLPK